MNETMNLLFNTPFLLVFSVIVWLVVTTGIGLASGWFSLMRRYPDCPSEVSILKFPRVSGYMRSVFLGMQGILTLHACSSGLRIGIIKAFGPFSKDFFVPWSEIRVVRKNYFFAQYAELTFGLGYGKLGIDPLIADRLWRTMSDSWPEYGTPPIVKSKFSLIAEAFQKWLALTALTSAFFLIVPKFMFPGESGPPAFTSVLLPAIVLGFASAFDYVRRSRLNK